MTADELRERVVEWAARIGVTPKEIRIAAMRGKWGCCSADGVITLAEDLMECEPEFIDVCLVHEALHLRVRNHGRLFKAFMSVYLPGWERMFAAGVAPKSD
jgi:hypothetical protein